MKICKCSLTFMLLIAMILGLTACNRHDRSPELHKLVMDEFAKYDAQNSVAVIHDDENIYLGNRTVNLKEIIEYDANFISINNALIFNSHLYFIAVTREETDASIFSKSLRSFLIYECDMNGQNLKLLFEMNGLKEVKTREWRGVFYITYTDESGETAISYDLFTKTKTVLESGDSCDVSKFIPPFAKKYLVEEEKNTFLITNIETNNQYVIDESFLKNTPYFDSFNGFDYVASRYSYIPYDNEKIILVYYINPNQLILAPEGKTLIIFEFDCRTQELIFDSTVFLPHCESMDLTYNFMPT